MVVGRGGDVQEIIRQLIESGHDQSLGVVSIVGVGGLGKTTLAKMVCNDDQIKKHFPEIIWVCVSEDFDVPRILREMMESLSISSSEIGVQNQDAAFKKIKEKLWKKNYLLVLDDVWLEDEQKWENLRGFLVGVTQKVGSSRVLVTTRIPRVVSMMQSLHADLKLLSGDDSWSLIKQAFGSTDLHPELEGIGKKIAEKCNGVPLVAKVVGGTLRDRMDKEQWLSIEKGFDACGPLVDNGRVLRVLKLSYDRLPKPGLKQCFAFCSFFPQDYVMEKETLIQLWMAEGFLQPNKSGKEMGDVGNEYFLDLVSYSFFQDIEWDVYGRIVSCKVHDLMHDLAKSISESETLVLEDSGSGNSKSESLVLEDGGSGTRHLNIICAPSLSPRRTVEVIQELHTLFSKVDVFSNTPVNFKRLLALSFRDSKMDVWPAFLGKLKRLRYLDISGTKVKEFPEFVNMLYHLQTFRCMDCCYLERHSKGVGNLISLKHLYSDRITPAGIGSLTSLQTLPFFVVSSEEGCGVEELEHLSKLKGDLMISNAAAIESGAKSKRAKLSEKSGIMNFRLDFGFNERLIVSDQLQEEIFESLRPPSKLKGLSLQAYRGRRMPSWMSDSYGNSDEPPCLINLVSLEIMYFTNVVSIPSLLLDKLVRMQIHGCDSLEKVPKLSLSSAAKLIISSCYRLKDIAVSSLQSLKIDGCHELAVVHFEQGATSYLQELIMTNCGMTENLEMVGELSSLEIFSLLSCRNLKCLGGSGLFTSTCLKELRVEGCNNLISIPSIDGLLSLQVVSIRDCGALVGVSVGTSSMPSLKQVIIDYCCEIESLPWISRSSSLEKILVHQCNQLKTVGSESFSSCTSLRDLKISECDALTSIPSLDGLSSLETIIVSSCRQLKTIGGESFSSCASLRELEILSCDALTSIPSLDGISSLETIHIVNCEQLRSIWGLWSLSSSTCLRELKISEFHSLTSVPNLHGLSSLQSIMIDNCKQLKSIEGESLSSCMSLRELEISRCPALMSIPSLDELSSLQSIRITECEHLKIIKGESTGLEKLIIAECHALTSIPSLDGLSSLERLVVAGCLQLKSIGLKNLSSIMRLRVLTIRRCHALTSIPCLDGLSFLLSIHIEDCPQLQSIEGESLSSLKYLHRLWIWECFALTSIPNLHGVTSLERLTIGYCGLSGLPNELSSSLHLSQLVLGPLSGEEIPDLNFIQKFHKSLHYLELVGWEKLKHLPPHIQNLTALEDLRLVKLKGLEALPDWLGSLSSLSRWYIDECVSLVQMPSVEAMRSLFKLYDVRINRCPELGVRCTKGTGSEWHKICHIRCIEITNLAPAY